MINGGRAIRIKEFLYIDRNAEGCGFVKPEHGEEFWGVPYGFDGETSLPYIEVYKNGKILRTINCADISTIEFDVE